MVTLDSIDTLGMPASFWNLPPVTETGAPIDYFTFNGRWASSPAPPDLHRATDWNLVAVEHADTPAGGVILRLIHLRDDDLNVGKRKADIAGGRDLDDANPILSPARQSGSER